MTPLTGTPPPGETLQLVTTPDSSTAPFADSIVVVSGLPRSGTSMLMRMLGAGGVPLVVDEDRPADEDNPHGYFEFTPVKALNKPGDKTWLAEARGKGIKIISFLLPYLPELYHYKVVFLKRRLAEVIASQNKMIERRGERGGTASDDAVASMFTAHLARVEETLATRPNFDVLYVEHRRAIEAPEEVAAAINGFLGNTLDARAMAAEIDQRLHRNRA
jgi:hypothetical protein